jgi:predicted DsbA family dithiol-disulfide isomerase
MCPWCIVGFRQLEQALGLTGMGARVRWHPFELNPQMGPDGQNLKEHLQEKYGVTDAQSAQNRAHLQQLGAELGIAFNFGDDSRIVNTFAAHQLLDWAGTKGLQHPLKLALFEAHFSKAQDVSDVDVLAEVAAQVGLDKTEAHEVLRDQTHAETVRNKQQFWTSRGISGVPSIVFGEKYLLTGAQGAQTYAQMLRRTVAEDAAA